MAVTSAKYASSVTAIETVSLTAAAADSSSPALTHSGYNTTADLSPTSTPAVSKVSYFSKALAVGAGTIDLTAIPGPGGTQDLTGLKVQMIKFKNDAANTITVSEGAASGYELLGNAWSIAIYAGSEVTILMNEDTPDVAAGAKNIDLAGTASQELKVVIWAG